MTARERVMAVVQGNTPDRTPTAFTFHFPAELQAGEAAINAHLRFFEESQADIGKIMNENLLRSEITVQTPADLGRERPSAATRAGIDAQVDLVKRIVDRMDGNLAALATIHGPMVSIHHMSGRSGFFVDNIDFYRQCKEENPAAMEEALKYATEALCELSRRCIEEAGADGIYFAALGAEKHLFSGEEYAEIVRPFDLMVFEAAKKARFNLLHVCKKGIDITRFMDYPVDVFNWEMHSEGNPTLEEALALVPEHRAILGGFFNAGGVLVQGTEEEIEAETHRLLKMAKGRRWIVGAGCTLPTGIEMARLRAVVRACESFAG